MELGVKVIARVGYSCRREAWVIQLELACAGNKKPGSFLDSNAKISKRHLVLRACPTAVLLGVHNVSGAGRALVSTRNLDFIMEMLQ